MEEETSYKRFPQIWKKESESTEEKLSTNCQQYWGQRGMCDRPKGIKLVSTREFWGSLRTEGPDTSEGKVVGLNKRIV